MIIMPRKQSTSSVGSHGGSSVFSGRSGRSLSTASSAPDIDQPGVLPCEFVGYTYCPMTFMLDDYYGWINHIINVHLRGLLPERAKCWFCDSRTFKSRGPEDLQSNFEERMTHIHQHLISGLSVHDMRPDFDLTDHLQRHGLIPDYTYRHATEYSEVYQGSWILGPNEMPSQQTSPWDNNQYHVQYESSQRRRH
ncbi:hypothetical protein F4777DRAFT_303586 [Nemania sp. FL0916]|nr:hypothetical protein F4777DRAFT_303586 [Nemania sp. FL0916]